MEVLFIDFPARILTATKTLTINSFLVNVDELREATLPDFTYHNLFQNHRYKHVIATRLSFPIGAKNLRVLTVE